MSEVNPKAQVKRLPGIGEYLQAKDRIRWFREQNGAGSIQVEILVIDIERGYAAVKARCTNLEGGIAENYGSAWRDVLHKKFTDSGRKGDPNAVAGDFLEFATTAAISRALAGLGYGTDDALDWEIGDLADAPVQRDNAPVKPAPAPTNPPADLSDKAMATELQIQAIRGLTPKAGMTPDGLLQSLEVQTLSALTHEKARKVIERLTAKAKERGQVAS